MLRARDLTVAAASCAATLLLVSVVVSQSPVMPSRIVDWSAL